MNKKRNHYSKPHRTATRQLASPLCHALQERAAVRDALLRNQPDPMKRAHIRATFDAGDERLRRAYATGAISSDLRRVRIQF